MLSRPHLVSAQVCLCYTHIKRLTAYALNHGLSRRCNANEWVPIIPTHMIVKSHHTTNTHTWSDIGTGLILQAQACVLACDWISFRPHHNSGVIISNCAVCCLRLVGRCGLVVGGRIASQSRPTNTHTLTRIHSFIRMHTHTKTNSYKRRIKYSWVSGVCNVSGRGVVVVLTNEAFPPAAISFPIPLWPQTLKCQPLSVLYVSVGSQHFWMVQCLYVWHQNDIEIFTVLQKSNETSNIEHMYRAHARFQSSVRIDAVDVIYVCIKSVSLLFCFSYVCTI